MNISETFRTNQNFTIHIIIGILFLFRSVCHVLELYKHPARALFVGLVVRRQVRDFSILPTTPVLGQFALAQRINRPEECTCAEEWHGATGWGLTGKQPLKMLRLSRM